MRNCFFVAFGWLWLCTNAGAAELGSPIDLSAFSEMDSVPSAPDEDLPIEEVKWEPETAHRRFYVSGIIGDSYEHFSTSGVTHSASVFTAGGAAGVAFARPLGALRLEFEGRGRDETTHNIFSTTTRYLNNWSTLINAWRDVAITGRLGVYAGGGLGAGGFSRMFVYDGTSFNLSQAVTTFAWQGGGGVTYQVSDCVTLDFGYRFYGLQDSLRVFKDDMILAPTTLSASEFLLSVRVYEPFRRWR